MARNGKIARLPRDIRDQLNRRMADAEPGGPLLRWLNALPEVGRIVGESFGGAMITKQNLSEWRAGGFAEWQARQEALSDARELAADAAELNAATDGRLTDHLATVLAARYASALRSWDGEVTEEFRRELRLLRGLCQDIVELRRGDHSGARMGMERERLEREREKNDAEVIAHFERWATNQAVRDWICQSWISPEERRRRLLEIFGREPEAEEAAVSTTAELESDPVQPSPAQSNLAEPGAEAEK